MSVRKGGSYAVDPNSGEASRVAGTEPKTFTREAQGAEAGAAEVPTSPAPAQIPSEEPPAARRSSRSAAAPKE